MKQLALTTTTLGLCAAAAAGQSLTTVAPGDTPLDWTSDGATILVSGFSDWATVDVATGIRTPLPPGGDFAVAIADNGLILGVMDDPVSGNNGSGILTGGTWVYLGNLPGVTSGCPELSSPKDISDDGAIAVGLGWDVCSARAFKWTGASGMTQLPQLGTNSTRADVVSADGSTIGGYERLTGSQNQATVWYSDGTQVMCAQTPNNPGGLGVTDALSSDGTWAAGQGVNGVGPWLFSQATGAIELGIPSGGAGSGLVAGVSDDGKVVVGFEGNFLGSRAWIWTSAGGMEWLDDYLTNLGITLPGNIGYATKISPDGTKILGMWDTGGFPSTKNTFIAEIPAQPTWEQYGLAASAVNYLDLDGGGSSGIGQVFAPTVSNVPAASLFAATGISLTQANIPVWGGFVLINPAVIATVVGAPAGTGSVTHAIPIPPSPSLWGASVHLQSLCDDLTQPAGWGLSNGLTLTL